MVDSAKILYQSGRGNVEMLKINGTMWMLLDGNDSAETQPWGTEAWDGLAKPLTFPDHVCRGLVMDSAALAKVGHAAIERPTDLPAQHSLRKMHKLAQDSWSCTRNPPRFTLHPLIMGHGGNMGVMQPSWVRKRRAVSKGHAWPRKRGSCPGEIFTSDSAKPCALDTSCLLRKFNPLSYMVS